MGRMHSAGKGQSLSMKPFSTQEPTHLTKSISEYEKLIEGLAKKGMPPAKIGTLLRDQHGIGNIADVLGMNLLQFLKKKNAAPSIPADLADLISKSSIIKTHLVIHPRDTDARYRLILANSKLHRVLRYYKEKGVMPKSWKPKKM